MNFEAFPQEIQDLILEKTNFLTVFENYPDNKYVLEKLYKQEKSFWTINTVIRFNNRESLGFKEYYPKRTITKKVKLDIIVFLKYYIKKVSYRHFSIDFMSYKKPSNIDLLLLRLYNISPEKICEFRNKFNINNDCESRIYMDRESVFSLEYGSRSIKKIDRQYLRDKIRATAHDRNYGPSIFDRS